MDNTTTIETKQRPLTDTQLAYGVLRQGGMKPYQIAKVLKLHKNSPYRMEKVVKQKFDLTDERLVSAAHNVLKKVMKGKPVSKGATLPKASDSLRASEVVLDRAQPKVIQSVSVNIQADPVDLSRFLGIKEDQ